MKIREMISIMLFGCLFTVSVSVFGAAPSDASEDSSSVSPVGVESSRNPFESGWDTETPRETVQTPIAPTNLKLEGIGIGPAGSFAVINGEVYREGEQKNGILISKIKKKEVDIITNGISLTLNSNRSGK